MLAAIPVNKLRQPLSAKQTGLVLAGLLLGAAALYGAYRVTTTFWHRRMLEKSIPGALAGIRAQREELAGVIETYKAHFGFYPPLLTPTSPDRGIINPLCYELLGTRFDRRSSAFYIPITKDGLAATAVRKFFKMDSFSNSLAFPTVPTNFLSNRAVAPQPLTRDADLFGLGLTYTMFTPEAFWEDYHFSPWRYATNPANHNPGKYDLWVEVDVAGKHFTIGNWSEVQ